MLEEERESDCEHVYSMCVERKRCGKGPELNKAIHFTLCTDAYAHTAHAHTQKLQNTIFAPVSKYLYDHMSMNTHEHMLGYWIRSLPGVNIVMGNLLLCDKDATVKGGRVSGYAGTYKSVTFLMSALLSQCPLFLFKFHMGSIERGEQMVLYCAHVNINGSFVFPTCKCSPQKI